MGTEAAAIAYHLLRTARRKGVDIRGLETRFALTLGEPVDISRRLPLSQAYELWEELLARANNPSFAFDAAAVPFPESVAAFVFITTSRRTVREAIDVLVARSAIITDAARFELDVRPRSAVLRVARPSDRIGARAAEEFMVTHVVHGLRCATGNRFRVKRVQFAHPSRGANPFDILGVVAFDAGETLIEVDASDLELPLDVLDGLTLILQSRIEPPDLISRARNAIALALAESGRASISTVARMLGLTPRTLQRQLPAGVTFHGLVQNAQRELALALVRTRPDAPIKEIALRSGFSSARAFSRAFRRWTGAPPGRERRRRA